MADILDSYIKKIERIQLPKRVQNNLKKVREQKNRFLAISAIKLEIFKIKLELKKNYINLGKFISKHYNQERVTDFSYKDDFFLMNQEINKKERYIKRLKNKIKS
tara:strand:- start:504 stop:818 length:315 start_codon:yes stop_codon:yes gene_type:complete